MHIFYIRNVKLLETTSILELSIKDELGMIAVSYSIIKWHCIKNNGAVMIKYVTKSNSARV